MSTSLRKFTTDFVPAEDRLRLRCELEDGQHLVLWLTQRLLRRLVPQLCNWLEKQVITVTAPAKHQAIVLEREQVHQITQQAARWELHEQKLHPVELPECPRSWVVQAVNLQLREGGVHLTLEGAEQAGYRMSFTPTSLYQWLGIVYRHCQAAQWPLAMWPEWIMHASTTRTPVGVTALLH